MARLTKRTVDALKPRERDHFEWDDEIKGFGVRVLPTGRKVFYAQYRQSGVQRRVKLGVYGAVTADEARTKAKSVLGDVADGENPALRIAFERGSPSVREVCERFMEGHVATHCKPRTATEYKRSVDLFIVPAFGNRRIVDIERADISALHHDMRDKPYQANRTLGVLSKMFNLAEVWGLRPDGSNPCRHVQKYTERKRERFLSAGELQRLGATLDELEATGAESLPAINAIRLLALTGCRLSEIQTLKWEYIDGAYIHLPDSKTGPRKTAIAPAVHQVLERIECIPGNPYVITGIVEGHHLTDMQRPWRRIRIRAGLEDVRIHDLRHTYASHALANGVDIPTVGKLLGHSQLQTTMRYAHLADEAIRDASEKVGGNLGGLIGAGAASKTGTDGKVVRFPR